MQRLEQLFLFAFDLIVVSFLTAAACFMFFTEWRQTKGLYFLGAWLVGIVVGLAAQRLGVPAGVDILVTAFAVITAPVTVMAMRHKTLLETIDEYRKKLGKKEPPASE